jgi:transposase InsO family protein
MSREVHVRFCEKLRVRVPQLTRPVAESFFHTLKTELTHHVRFKTRGEAKQSIFEYIEIFYNKKRIHSSNDYLSPEEYEKAHRAA